MQDDNIKQNCDVLCGRSPYHSFQENNGVLQIYKSDEPVVGLNGFVKVLANGGSYIFEIPLNSIVLGFYKNVSIPGFNNPYFPNASTKFKPNLFRFDGNGAFLYGSGEYTPIGTAVDTGAGTPANGTIVVSVTANLIEVTTGETCATTGNLSLDITDNNTAGVTWSTASYITGTLSGDYVDPITGETVTVSYTVNEGYTGTLTTTGSSTVAGVTTYDVAGVSQTIQVTAYPTVNDIYISDNGGLNPIEIDIQNTYLADTTIDTMLSIQKLTDLLGFISCSVLKTNGANNNTQNEKRYIVAYNKTTQDQYIGLAYLDYSWLYR